jgi:cyclopropane-fatty-acyl-phospholipid synthase
MNAAAKRLQSLRNLLAHARKHLGIDAGFVLWDGSTVPSDLPADAFAIVFADEGAVAALLRRPKLDTILNLWVAARFDLRNGTLFDLAAQRPRVRTKELMKSLDKRLAFDAARRFLLVPRGGPWPLVDIKADRTTTHNFAEDKANIHYHYDVSNAFYALWLDPDMVYTCAYFTDWNNDIAVAQRDKLDMVCRKLRLQPGETLLDLGCGFGGLVCYAAQNYGVKAYGVTLAEQQARFANDKIARLGIGDRAKVECRDYASVEGQYDKVSAICILEHVGIDNNEIFFDTVQR